ncbi:MAG: hypothetical protein ACR2HY_06715 [Acidimicrobiales bacterium]
MAQRDPQDAGSEPATPLGGPLRPEPRGLVEWLRWAAAPLGFLVVVGGLTLYGVLRPGGGSGSSLPVGIAPSPSSSAAVVTTTPVQATTTPTTVAGGLQTTAAPPTPTTSTPAARSARPAKAPTPTTASFTRCGLVPGQTVHISVNGRPAATVTADSRGCASVGR